MGCYYTLCHNTYAYSLLFYKVYIKRENAGSWNSGLEKEQILETYSAQLQKSWNSTKVIFGNNKKYWVEEIPQGAHTLASRVGGATTREKPSSSAVSRYISSAGTGATNKALQLTLSSSVWALALLVYKCSSSVIRASSLLLIALACLGWTRYCYCHAAANFLHLLLLILVVFVFSAYLFCIWTGFVEESLAHRNVIMIHIQMPARPQM